MDENGKSVPSKFVMFIIIPTLLAIVYATIVSNISVRSYTWDYKKKVAKFYL